MMPNLWSVFQPLWVIQAPTVHPCKNEALNHAMHTSHKQRPGQLNVAAMWPSRAATVCAIKATVKYQANPLKTLWDIWPEVGNKTFSIMLHLFSLTLIVFNVFGDSLLTSTTEMAKITTKIKRRFSSSQFVILSLQPFDREKRGTAQFAILEHNLQNDYRAELKPYLLINPAFSVIWNVNIWETFLT